MSVVFFIGEPGGGKTTQCRLLAKKYPDRFCTLSTGDILRAEAADKESPYSETIANLINNGNLVPPDITVTLLMRKMKSLPPGSTLLLDGFPRNIIQTEAWDRLVGEWDDKKNLAINLFCPIDVCVTRLLLRGAVSDRADDKDESIIRHRFSVMSEETTPVLERWGPLGHVARVDGDASIEEVTKRLEDTLTSRGFLN